MLAQLAANWRLAERRVLKSIVITSSHQQAAAAAVTRLYASGAADDLQLENSQADVSGPFDAAEYGAPLRVHQVGCSRLAGGPLSHVPTRQCEVAVCTRST